MGTCAVALLAWVFVFSLYIIGRFFGVVWLFVEEYTGYWMVFITYMALAFTLIAGSHISVDIVTRRLTDKTRSILQVCTDSMGVVLVCYLLGRSIEWVIYGIRYDLYSLSSLRTPLWLTFLPVPIGLTLFALALATKLGKNVIELMRARGIRTQEG